LIFCLTPILRSNPIPLEQQPFPDSISYAREAIQIANGNGFKIDINESVPLTQQKFSEKLYPSRYPPGFSLILTPFVRFSNNQMYATQLGSKAVSVSLLLLIFLLAWFLSGALAAMVVIGITAWSPFLEASSRLVMSDALGASITMVVVLTLLFASRHQKRTKTSTFLYVLAGAFAGLGIISRSSLAVILIALLIATRPLRHLRWVLVGVLPFLIFLGTYQWTEFGNPLKTGYDYYLPDLKEFSLEFVSKENLLSEREFIYQEKLNGSLMKWTCPCDEFGPVGKASNLIFYPSVLLGVYWFYYPPLIALFGFWSLWQRRQLYLTKLSVLIIMFNLLMFLFYFYQGARLIAPAAFLLLVYSAVGIVDLLRIFWRKSCSRFLAHKSQCDCLRAELTISFPETD
jgi:4-amino-4-deoxy-L-arabinose transferase-like glycosyltransferase